jgi:hypothetical protein
MQRDMGTNIGNKTIGFKRNIQRANAAREKERERHSTTHLLIY